MVQLNCQKCGYDWDYHGAMSDYATCPDCKTSVPLKASDSATRTTGEGDRLDRMESKMDYILELLDEVPLSGDSTESTTEEVEVETAEVNEEDVRDDLAVYHPDEEFR